MRVLRALKAVRFPAAVLRVLRAVCEAPVVSTRICTYMCERGILAGGEGGRYTAKGAVLEVFCRRKTPAVPFRFVGVAAGVRPVCIQWRRVETAGGVFVGMSISIIMTAYEVPVSLVCVPIWGIVVTAGRGNVSGS